MEEFFSHIHVLLYGNFHKQLTGEPARYSETQKITLRFSIIHLTLFWRLAHYSAQLVARVEMF